MNIRIITDSAADFTQEALSRHDITCVPMHITVDDAEYVDGVTLTPDEFWKRMISGQTPKTSQPSPDDFLGKFEAAKAAGEAVVCVLISSALSGTLQSAVIARSMIEYDEIYIVDTLCAAIAEQVMVLEACRLRDAGDMTAAQIAQAIEAFRSRVKLFACLDTLEYLARGGRIPKAAANIGSLVQLKPLVTINADGMVDVMSKAIGRHRASDALIKLASGFSVDADYPIIPIYAHTPDNCEAFVKRLPDALPCRAQDMAPIGPTISTHIGPGAFGFVLVSAKE